MTRLTKDIRENIVTDLLHKRFKDEGQALAQRSADLFKRVYEDRYDLETRRLMARIAKRHRGAFVQSVQISCNTTGYRVAVGKITIGYEAVKFTPTIEPRPFLCNNGSDFFSYGDCPIGEALREYATDSEAFKNSIKGARFEALGALSNFTTVKQMQEGWPEVMAIAERRIPVGSGGRNLPAVQFKKLTDFYGLADEAEGGVA
jgi:Nucleotide modification associated domain 5